MNRVWIAAMSLAVSLGAAPGFAAEADGAACRAAKPVDFHSGPAHWQGPCPGGVAEGLGAMRIGSAEPYEFFLGEMKAGKPVRGLLKMNDGWMVANSFDAASKVQSDNSGRDFDALWQLGVRAAQATSRRFKDAGNARSAAYYQRLAKAVTDGQPE
ncbi:MAG: hypothetical protein V4764_21425 [Burkholderia sp.]